jgi:hypothetical protein
MPPTVAKKLMEGNLRATIKGMARRKYLPIRPK